MFKVDIIFTSLPATLSINELHHKISRPAVNVCLYLFLAAQSTRHTARYTHKKHTLGKINLFREKSRGKMYKQSMFELFHNGVLYHVEKAY